MLKKILRCDHEKTFFHECESVAQAEERLCSLTSYENDFQIVYVDLNDLSGWADYVPCRIARAVKTETELDVNVPGYVKLLSSPYLSTNARIWSQLLGVDLSEGRLVCELHFSKESIKMEDQIRLADGTLHIIPRQKWTLKEGAIPVAIAEKENIECDQGIQNIHSEGPPVSSSPIFEETPAVQVPNAQENVVPICRANHCNFYK